MLTVNWHSHECLRLIDTAMNTYSKLTQRQTVRGATGDSFHWEMLSVKMFVSPLHGPWFHWCGLSLRLTRWESSLRWLCCHPQGPSSPGCACWGPHWPLWCSPLVSVAGPGSPHHLWRYTVTVFEVGFIHSFYSESYRITFRDDDMNANYPNKELWQNSCTED